MWSYIYDTSLWWDGRSLIYLYYTQRNILAFVILEYKLNCTQQKHNVNIKSDLEGGHERTILYLQFGSGEKAQTYYIISDLN